MGIALLGFGVAITFWPGLMSAAVVPRWCLIALGLPLVSWLDPRCLGPVTLALLIAYVGYAGVSLLWAPDPMAGSNDLFRVLIFAGCVLAGANVEDPTMFMRAMGWGVTLSSVLIVMQSAGWSGIAQATPPAGLFYNRDFAAELAAVFFVWAVFSRDIPLAVMLAIPLAVCGSRIALACAALGFVSARPRWAVLPVMIMGATVVSLTLWHPEKLTTLMARMDIWEFTLFGVTPFGEGLGGFAVAQPVWEYAHSDLLQSFYELGIGALPLLAIMVLALRAVDLPIRAAMACLVGEYATAFPLHLPATALVAGVLVGHLARKRVDVDVGRYVGRAYAGACV